MTQGGNLLACTQTFGCLPLLSISLHAAKLKRSYSRAKRPIAGRKGNLQPAT